MLKNDLRWIRMSYSLLFALPGAVMLLYGDEIGMGDDLRLPERVSVRIPMQWDTSENGGFSSVDPSGVIRTVKNEGALSYKVLNVQSQQNDPHSLLSHITSLTKLQKEHLDIGHGKYTMLSVHPSSVFALSFTFEGKTLITLHNFSDEPCTVVLEDLKYTTMTEFYSDAQDYDKEVKASTIPLRGFGYRWFMVKTENE